MQGTPYFPLRCKSNFSFLEGASAPRELFQQAKALGIPGLALVDRNGIYGMVRAHIAAKEFQLKLLIGATIYTETSSPITLLVTNQNGYANLCHLITLGRLRSSKGKSRNFLHELCEHAKGLIALGEAQPCLVDAFPQRFYVPLARHLEPQDNAQERHVQTMAKRFKLPVVAANQTLYHHRSRQSLHDVLTCIREGCSLEQAGTKIKPNAEYALLSPLEFNKRFEDYSVAQKHTLEIAERCTYSLSEINYKYPSEVKQGEAPSIVRLRMLAEKGLQIHFGTTPTEKVVAQLDRELEIIEDLEYSGYFLTMYEIVEFCRREGILCQGRGSAANSLVCFCLGVTAINPAEMELLFERFLSRERAEPPDIDLDIEHNRREEVIQYVYKKYGRNHAAMLCNFIRYRPKSAIRDVGKVLGIPEVLLAQSSKLHSRCAQVIPEILVEAGFDPKSKSFSHLSILSNQLLGFPRHTSIHPGGFLLGSSPVHNIVPIENGSMPNRTVIQWDKDDIEELGLFKVDLLGLGALHQLHLCFDLIEKHYGHTLSMATIPKEDPATYKMMSRADTIGVFQIESRAQMSMLPRLKPRCFYDLVIEISIIRPGPITGGMVHPFLRRRRGEEEVVYPHKLLEPILKKTLGIPLFQEQVMRLAMVAADYSPGEADQLRRDMAAWRQKGKIEKHRDILINRMCAKGISQEFAERVFEQILGFGEYGFPESHAASFALIAYATSWLKWHYPAEFTCSLLNAQPMGFYSPATLIGDVQRHGVLVLPIDINQSEWHCTIELQGNESCIRMGLRYVKGLGEGQGCQVLSARTKPFHDIDDTVRRSNISRKSQILLAESGVFSCFGKSRRDALWSAYRRNANVKDVLALPPNSNAPSFEPLSRLDQIQWDLKRNRHSPQGHPLQTLRSKLQSKGFPSAAQLLQSPDGSQVQYAGIVICRQRPMTAKGVTFMTMEDETGFINLVIWKSTFDEHHTLAKTVSFLAVSGKIQNHEGIVHLIAKRLWQPEIQRYRPPPSKTRDFC